MKMKMLALLIMSMVAVTAFAGQKGNGRGTCIRDGSGSGRKVGAADSPRINYVDSNGDGICDNYKQ